MKDKNIELDQKVSKQIERRQSNLEKIYGKERAIKMTLAQLKSQIDELNTLNAIENRGPVDIEDYLYRYNLTQEILNKKYEDVRSKRSTQIEEEKEI